MGFEESRKHLLRLSYHELQCLCKRYNLPANKTHAQLASSLASLLEESLATTPAPSAIIKEISTCSQINHKRPATTPCPLAIIKEVSTCNQINHKRAPYTGRDDDISLLHAKHQKGPQTAVGEASKRGIDTSTSISPVPINNGRLDCRGHSFLEPGNTHNAVCQDGVCSADKTTNPEVAYEHHSSPGNITGQISAPVIRKHPVIDNGIAAPSGHAKDVTDKGCGPSDVRSEYASPVHFFVMSDEGINLVVDLNSSPLDLTEKFNSEVSIPPSEPGNFSSFFSSLVNKDDHSTVSPSANIVVDIQSKGTDSNGLSTNSSLGSDVGDNSRSEPYPTDTTVNTVSSASILHGTSVELSGYQEGAPMVSSSCLTAEVPNSKVSDMMVCASDKEVLPQESVDVLLRSERIPTSLVDASGSGQPTGKDMKSPGKTKVLGNIGCIQKLSVADADNLSAFSLGDVVRSGSNEQYSSKTSRKQTVNAPGGAHLAHNGDTHGVLMEPVEAMAVEGDTGFGDRLSVSSQLARQTVTKLPGTDAQSEASSADHHIVGNFDLTNPTSSSAASDNAANPLTSKCGAESAQSHSADKKSGYDPEELEESESKMPPAYGEPPRNILLSLRSASARKTKPTRRSPRLVPK